MNLPGLLLLRQRVAVCATAKMIVVRAQRDPRFVNAGDGARRRQIGDDVARRFAFRAATAAAHGDGDVRDRKPGDVRVAGIKLLLHRLELFVRGARGSPLRHRR